MTLGFSALKQTDIKAYPGFTVKDLVLEIQRNPDSLEGYDAIILHVGTNNIGEKWQYNQYVDFVMGRMSKPQFVRLQNHWHDTSDDGLFKSDYRWLIDTVLWANPSAYILCSAIIQRPWDMKLRNGLRKHFNNIISTLSSQSSLIYISTDRIFYDRRSIFKDCYFGKKGLHLSDKGSLALQTFFSDKLRKAVLKQIY